MPEIVIVIVSFWYASINIVNVNCNTSVNIGIVDVNGNTSVNISIIAGIIDVGVPDRSRFVSHS